MTDDVRDLSGNTTTDFVSLFTTGSSRDSGRPSIVTMYPGNNANDVRLDKSIVLHVSERIDPFTVDADSVKVSQNGALISGTTLVSSDNQVIHFTPDAPWAQNSVIQVFVENRVTDLSGNALNTYQGTFRTAADNRAFGSNGD